MDKTKTILISEEIQKTIDKLYLRINDRFPESGLSKTCQALHKISLETNTTLEWITCPNYLIRFSAYLIISIIVFGSLYSVSNIELCEDSLGLADLVQMVGSALEGLAIAGAGVIFIVTFENKRKRTKVISSVNRLRSVAHIIDIHQLTKDPEAMKKAAVPTVNSPERKLNNYELSRYLNYCSEMLALTSKLGFLYVQKFPDSIATDAVNDLEKLTTDLSRKIWQKIMLIDGQRK